MTRLVKRLPMRLGNSRGFSLIELVAVMAVMGILMVLLGIGYLSYMEQAKRTEVMTTFGHLKTSTLKLNADLGLFPTAINQIYCSTAASAAFGTQFARWDTRGYWTIPDPCGVGVVPRNRFGGNYDIVSGSDLNGDGTTDAAVVATNVEAASALKIDQDFDDGTAGTGSVIVTVDPGDATRRVVSLVIYSY